MFSVVPFLNSIFYKRSNYSTACNNLSLTTHLQKRSFAHLYEPQSGTIYINNVGLNEYKEKDTLKEIEYIGQNEKNVNPYEIVDPYHRYSREKIEKDLGYTLNDELSKGQMQYLYLYKALRSEKSVIILDEIFSYVDMDKIKNAFSKFKEMKKIIIVVTHEKEVMQFCDSTISMEDL